MKQLSRDVDLPLAADKIAVVGAGVVGALVARCADAFPGFSDAG
jgi:hypothetical protein